jgi:hypothetical protein
MTSSTWNSQPASGEWNKDVNWSPAGLPADKALFENSTQTAISVSATGEARVGEIEFSDRASAYSFTFGPCPTPALTITGGGVENRSGRQQSFIVAATSSGYKDPQLKFINSATAGGDDVYYCAGPESEQGYGGGVICFLDNTTAGSASFKAWTGAGTPPKHNTVGGEISFCDASSADNARFTIYGSLGDDGDTFGNVVFHNSATAAQAVFTNVGGTVSGGDGGNTQFYGNSTAAFGTFYNWGGSHQKANGGDVAFDATANGDHGHYYNYAAKVEGAYGGVTSFNNNPPDMVKGEGASAGKGAYFNYGAREGERGGGGHVEFSARYGSPTGANATIVNYGSRINHKSTAGHTIFSINRPTDYFPTAGKATIYNHPGLSEEGAAGYTQFSVYGSGSGEGSVPTAGDGTLLNLGATISRAAGGFTQFSGNSSAGNATLIAYGGINGGHGGRILFYDQSSGGTARVQLFGNAELDISYHSKGVTIDTLDLNGGILVLTLGTNPTTLTVSGEMILNSTYTNFSFRERDQGGFALNTTYTILTSANLSGFRAEQFKGNSIGGVEPAFSIVDNNLQVIFAKQ